MVEATARMDAEVAAKTAGATKVNTLAQLMDGMLEGLSMPMNEGTTWKQEQGRCAKS